MFKNLTNIIDFFLRSNIKFCRRGLLLKNESKIGIFKQEKLNQKEFVISEKYNLTQLKNNSTVQNYLENLYTIDILEQTLKLENQRDNIKILDIGSKNWFYAQGEHAYFSNFTKNIELNGVELDGYRVYTDFHSRKDYANFYIQNLNNTSYIVDNLLNITKKYTYITWFLPFVTKEPLLNWGLPINEFKPEILLEKAYSLLETNGQLLIVNQGLEEHKVQIKLLKKLEIEFIEIGEISSDFFNYKNKRFAMIVKK